MTIKEKVFVYLTQLKIKGWDIEDGKCMITANDKTQNKIRRAFKGALPYGIEIYKRQFYGSTGIGKPLKACVDNSLYFSMSGKFTMTEFQFNLADPIDKPASI